MDLKQAQDLFNQAVAAYQNNDLELAIQLSSQIEKSSDEVKEIYAQAQVNLGILFKKLNRYKEAKQAYKNVNREDSPKAYAAAKVSLGNLQFELKRFKQAKQAYSKVRAEDSGKYYAFAQWNLYWSFGQDKDYLIRIKKEHDLETYAEARFVLGNLQENLDAKNEYWQQIPQETEQ